MSASDNLSPQQFFHVTDASLRPGSLVTSPSSRGVKGKWEGKRAQGYSPDKVYVHTAESDDPSGLAHLVMGHHGRRHYQVEPLGPLEDDADPTPGGVVSYSTSHARVIKDIGY